MRQIFGGGGGGGIQGIQLNLTLQVLVMTIDALEHF